MFWINKVSQDFVHMNHGDNTLIINISFHILEYSKNIQNAYE